MIVCGVWWVTVLCCRGEADLIAIRQAAALGFSNSWVVTVQGFGGEPSFHFDGNRVKITVNGIKSEVARQKFAQEATMLQANALRNEVYALPLVDWQFAEKTAADVHQRKDVSLAFSKWVDTGRGRRPEILISNSTDAVLYYTGPDTGAIYPVSYLIEEYADGVWRDNSPGWCGTGRFPRIPLAAHSATNHVLPDARWKSSRTRLGIPFVFADDKCELIWISVPPPPN